MEPAFEARDLQRVRPTAWTRVMPLIPLIGLLQLPAFFANSLTLALVTSLVVLTLPLLTTLEQRARASRRPERGVLRIDRAGVTWNDRLLAPREQIAGGVLVPLTPDGDLVRFSVPGGPVEFLVPDLARGREVLRAAGFEATDATATFRGRSRFSAGVFGLLAGLALVLGLVALESNKLALLPCALVLMLLGPLAFARTTVTVGSDGVLLQWLGTRRFVPWTAVERAEGTRTGVELLCRDGTRITVPVGPTGNDRGRVREEEFLRAERDALLDRIEAAMAAKPGDAPVLDPSLLARGERSVSDWRVHLRALAQRTEGGMRAAPVLREQLLAWVNDAHAAPDARAAAAVALGASDDPVAREKLRAAARAVASPKLRVVFDTAATGEDDAALAHALEQVESEHRRAG